MLGDALFGLSRWMARRNGRALARSIAAQLRQYRQRGPTQPAVDHWQELLENRPGWHRVRQYLYEFRTGQRLELKAKPEPEELIRWLADAELKPLAAGLAPPLQGELLRESIAAALACWKAP